MERYYGGLGTKGRGSPNERRKPGLKATQQREETCDGFECPFYRELVSVLRQHVASRAVPFLLPAMSPPLVLVSPATRP